MRVDHSFAKVDESTDIAHSFLQIYFSGALFSPLSNHKTTYLYDR